ncbi:hypothetical protein K435DRAFT_58175 [Dendrothele bispora CBS 962.96]|uniref:Histone-lysine N-methyltransferase, H3 lysine-4 specific n=1 Tax=Dendrothele bispora (strain CBS 962.96) TaxID=1314807 RepID=A0A4S8M5V1_DENBC|nr:hypothetical protein K435DRAFT_58175 [Dendrothele bispora CBS 962.96]
MKNGMDHVMVEGDGGGQVPRNIREEDVLDLFNKFTVDKVLKSSKGLFVTFQTNETARRAATYINGLRPQLAFRPVVLTVHPAPKTKTTWEQGELIELAGQMLIKELKKTLEMDIMQSVVVATMGHLVEESKVETRMQAPERSAQKFGTQGLSGLSFRKQKKVAEIIPGVPEVVQEDEEDDEEEKEEPPKKKRKRVEVTKKKTKRVVGEESGLESEDDTIAGTEEIISKKRTLSAEPEIEEEEPVKKKPKREALNVKKKKKETKTKKKAGRKGQAVDDVVQPDDVDPSFLSVVRLPVPGIDSSLSPSRESSPVSRRLTTPPPTPPPVELGVCDDDEDLYYAKLALSGVEPPTDSSRPPVEQEPTDNGAPSPRRHLTGSARSEGYYKITHAEKAAYVAQYQTRSTNVAAKDPTDEPPAQVVTSSRSNRADARRRAQGLEEINMVQRALALSKGETANELSFKFNQLQTRKKHLRFARSPIHDWGLYAMERISRGEMVIEYVGEIIRAQVADKREKTYERQGIGSSYLFRIDEDLVVDATKKGNLGRLINHSCDPNCTAKIITINGEKKIVIYAKQDIELGDEITYDYHFPFEQDKIPCLCGSTKCRGFLN